MSRATSIAGVRPLGWLARLQAQRSLAGRAPLGWRGRCGAGAITALGMGARDDHAKQRSGARPSVVQTDTLACADARSTSLPHACHTFASGFAEAPPRAPIGVPVKGHRPVGIGEKKVL